MNDEPGLLLRHSYAGNTEDVLDASGRGNIGEFLRAVRVPSPAGGALYLPGKTPAGEPTGYRVMPSDDLELASGTVSFWLCVSASMAGSK